MALILSRADLEQGLSMPEAITATESTHAASCPLFLCLSGPSYSDQQRRSLRSRQQRD